MTPTTPLDPGVRAGAIDPGVRAGALDPGVRAGAPAPAPARGRAPVPARLPAALPPAGSPVVPTPRGAGLLGQLAGALPRRRAGAVAVGEPVVGAPDDAPDARPGPRDDPQPATPLARAEGWLAARSGHLAADPPAAPPTKHALPSAAPADMPAAVPSATAADMPAALPSAPPADPAADLVRPDLLPLDGRRVALVGTLLVGRDPAPRAGETVGALVVVDDPARSVSKTHLLIGADDAGVWVTDRHSTNGTVVTLPDGQRILCVPGRRVRLVAGASVVFGDHGFTLVGETAGTGPH